MRTTVQELINQLQKLNPNSIIETSSIIEIPTCPTCGQTHTVESCSGYGWYCKNGCGAWGRD